MPASVAVWQLPSTEPVLKQQMECSLSLPPVPRVVTTPDVPAIPSVPKNIPVSQVSHAPSLATPPPPSVSVSWTQHRSSASPSPSQVTRPPPLSLVLSCPFRWTKLWTILWTIFPETSYTACDVMAHVLCEHKKLAIYYLYRSCYLFKRSTGYKIF